MIKNAREALYIACEMERRAVKMYQRGGMVCPHMKDVLAQYELEERSHLERFTQMGEALGGAAPVEDQILLNAQAAQVIFAGGLMEAKRENAFDDMASFLAYAAGQEAQAIETYRQFAELSDSAEAREMFLAIASEETVHHDVLSHRLQAL